MHPTHSSSVITLARGDGTRFIHPKNNGLKWFTQDYVTLQVEYTSLSQFLGLSI